MRRRRHGEGTIYKRIEKRKDGSKRVRYVAELVKNGKRQRIYGISEAEVREKLNAVRVQSERLGRLPDADRTTVGEWLDYWLENIAKPRLEIQSVPSLERAIRLRIKPLVGDVRLRNFNHDAIERLYADLREQGVTDRLMREVHIVLSGALKRAVKRHIIAENPMDDIAPPKYHAAEKTFLSDAQAHRFIAAAMGTRLEALFLLAILRGVRQGELFALRWGDIDFPHKTLTIQRNVIMDSNRPALKDYPKTGASRRTLTLTPDLYGALERRREAAKRESRSDLVFPNENGGLLRRNNFNRRAYRAVFDRANESATEPLPYIEFHNLRHTAASLMLKAGIHIKVVSEILGHSKASITIDLYSHLIPGIQGEAMERFYAFMNPSAPSFPPTPPPEQ
jgi:integrase